MRKQFTSLLAAALLLGGVSARAQTAGPSQTATTSALPARTPIGGSVAGSASVNPTAVQTAPPVADVTGNMLPPPPPASVTVPPSVTGVPPTPAPAFPGLPAPPTSGTTANSTGLPTPITGQLRASTTGQAPVSVADVQNQLAGAGLYRGPIDGVLSGPTRSSIRAFQEAAGLPATGELDVQTAAALGVSGFVPAPTPTTTTPAPGARGAAGIPSTPFPLSVPAQAPPFAASPLFIQP